MRKIIMFNMISLDGKFEGPNHDINWHNTDEEFGEFANQQLSTAGGLIFGRRTYQLMADYWQSASAAQDETVTTGWMNRLPKVVVSRTMEKANWNNTFLIKDDAAGELKKLKQEDGQDMFLFGSADLAASLIPEGLIDEYRIMINPIVLVEGTPLFKNGIGALNLKLTSSRTFKNGNVLLTYEPC